MSPLSSRSTKGSKMDEEEAPLLSSVIVQPEPTRAEKLKFKVAHSPFILSPALPHSFLPFPRLLPLFFYSSIASSLLTRAQVGGMTCGSCSSIIENVVSVQKEVIYCQVNLLLDEMTVTCSGDADLSAVSRSILLFLLLRVRNYIISICIVFDWCRYNRRCRGSRIYSGRDQYLP